MRAKHDIRTLTNRFFQGDNAWGGTFAIPAISTQRRAARLVALPRHIP